VGPDLLPPGPWGASCVPGCCGNQLLQDEQVVSVGVWPDPNPEPCYSRYLNYRTPVALVYWYPGAVPT
jgi:hypothetical protein